ncbi:phage major tail protein, TP901-1 family [Pseudorhizobium flavum]|uniref:TP901-1 family phage major tail protein n=1 Tax=Pseudorhizobium flavum TaxID=1335061 RepID=A0A7W9YYQ9_9HYPH|nr:phage major tail protein, TP901-1 family [Pseudorhizobium flavum]MBB6180863.1 TP901-1 family phage major tail protein [Pseudorhizobium flavum]CAD6602301.1 phage major tail protein, TP901-1 family [Pseudorhizobium flavum]CAD6608955.1 phage major tail protein, TP901-1 family [Rhizobium sp. TCK]CAD6610833.1 phage major tail protein, TP901-1 family [Rhizobium sp. Khangiran2]
MVAQKGKDLLLKIDSGGSYVTVAGLRSRRLAFNAETVDVTDAESAGRWRELLGGAGVQRASLTGAGLFKDQASDALVRQAFFAGSILSWQVLIPDFGTVTGPFQITALEYSGEHNGELRFELALESAGQLSFGAL